VVQQWYSNLMGKRVGLSAESAQSLITDDPNLALDDVGVSTGPTAN
jgi:DNA-directed RNA polymerase beta' subunit